MYPAGVHARVAIVPVAVKIVVVDVEVVVSQYNKNLPSLLESAGSSAPDSISASVSLSEGLSGCMPTFWLPIASSKIFLLFLFLHVVNPVVAETKQTVLVETEEVVDELDTKNSFG